MITRLSERALASLYDQCQAPVRLHLALHSDEGLNDNIQTEIEGIIRFNPPDLALISLGLCAVVLAESIKEKSSLVTELKYLGIESVESFGPAYLGEQSGLEDLDELLNLCPIHLCALGSAYEEMAEDAPIAKLLSEIAYDQADRAECLLAGEPMSDHTPAAPMISEASNVVPLDLFATWRKQKEPAE